MSEISGKKSVVAVVPCDTYDEEKVYGLCGRAWNFWEGSALL